MTCACKEAVPESMYRGGGGGGKKKRRGTKRTKRTRKGTKRRKRLSKKVGGGTNVNGGTNLTGTIADGPDGTAFGKMTGAQIAGSHAEINADVIHQGI